MRLLSVFFLWTSVCAAQQIAPVLPATETPPKIVLKFALLSLIDNDPTVQGAVEYIIKPKLSVQQELGFMRISNWMNVDEKYPRTIFRSRSEVRLYLSQRRTIPEGGYLALEGFYKYLNQPQEGEVNRGSYFETKNYRYLKQVAGGHIKLGIQSFFGSSDRWLFDGYFGFGIRTIWMSVKGEGVSIDTVSDDPFDILFIRNGRSQYAMPSMSFGFKFGYAIYPRSTAR